MHVQYQVNIHPARRAVSIHDQLSCPFPFTVYPKRQHPRVFALKMVAGAAHMNADILLLPQGHERVVMFWHFTFINTKIQQEMCTMKAYVLGLFLINPITLVFMSSPSSFYSLRSLAANEILHLSVK